MTVSIIKIAIITIYLSIASPLIGSEVEYLIKQYEEKNLAFIAECEVDPKCDTSSKEFFEKYKKLVEEQTKELHEIIQHHQWLCSQGDDAAVYYQYLLFHIYLPDDEHPRDYQLHRQL